MIELKSLLEQKRNEDAINLSIKRQVMCKLTSYICRVKENPELKEMEGYYLKMKNALEGPSILKSSVSLIYVKTLTGKTIEI